MQLEATHLFNTGAPVHLDIDHRMYSIKTHAPENWVWHAFKGFGLIKSQFESVGFTPKTFAAIGSGSGVDAIGAARIFTGLERIVVTDVEDDVVRQAAENVRRNVSDDIEVIGLSGNVCAPLAEQGIQADVIYANLPNIPLSGTENLDYGTFYRIDQEKVGSGAQEEADINRYLLGLQYSTWKA